jgi:hypothetical protein
LGDRPGMIELGALIESGFQQGVSAYRQSVSIQIIKPIESHFRYLY